MNFVIKHDVCCLLFPLSVGSFLSWIKTLILFHTFLVSCYGEAALNKSVGRVNENLRGET